MNLELIYLFILGVGALQGLVLSPVLLFGSAKKRLHNRILGGILLVFVYRLIVQILQHQGIVSQQSFSYYFALELNWLWGSLIFFYVMTYVQPDYQLSTKDWIHFLPIMFEIGLSTFVKLQNLYWDGTTDSLSWAGYHGYRLWMHTPFQYIVSGILILAYIVYAKRLLWKDMTVKLIPKAFNWIRQIMWMYIGFSVLVIVICLIDYLFFNYAFQPQYRFPVFSLMAMITYWLGLQGYTRRAEEPIMPIKGKAIVPLNELQVLHPKLIALMQAEKPYLNPKLGLADLAKQLDVKPYVLTQLLNRLEEKSYRSYVNEYRVKAVIEMMKQPKFANYTLLGIAMEAGFNSKASFNRSFKKVTGQSPKDFK